jgi:hypothetical protein
MNFCTMTLGVKLVSRPEKASKPTESSRVSAMNFNLFSVIAASATVALPASASTVVSDKKSASYTQKYLQQSANFYAALDHKTRS